MDAEVPDTPSAATPDVVGLDAVDACAMVRRAGLVPYQPGYASEPTTGVVLDQAPAAATVTTVGDPVFLDTDPGSRAPD